MRFAEYVTRILALMQEDGLGKGKTSTGRHWFAYCCVITAVPPKQQRKRLIQTVGLTLARTQYVHCSAAS